MTPRRESLELRAASDVVRARQITRELSVALGFSLVDQTKLVTAASEIARNTVEYGRGGSMLAEEVRNGARVGLKLMFEDQGPGIHDIPQALRDGFTTGNGMGLGLGGARRLVNEFDIESNPGNGTRVTLVRWK